MEKELPRAQIRVEFEVRTSSPVEAESRRQLLEIVAKTGRELKAHVLFAVADRLVGLFVCDDPIAAALALEESGVETETETVVTVETEDRPRAMSRILQTLAAESISVGYSYSASSSGKTLIVIRTDHNPKAEDVLRRLFLLAEDSMWRE